MSDSADDEFATLKPSLRRAIDTAFLKLSRQARGEHGTQPPQKRPRLEDPESDEEGGGFVKDDQDEREESEEEQDGIPLSMIPKGLQMLDLPPDDEDVLSVFRNASTGWEHRPGIPRRQRSGSDDEEVMDKDAGLSVSQEDWRAVCAVLLGQKEDGDDVEEGRPTKKQKKSTRSQDKGQEQPERRVTRGQARAAAKQVESPKKQIEAQDEDEGGGFLVEDGGFIPGSDDEQGGFIPASDEELGDAQDESDSDRYSDNDVSSVSEFGAPTQPKSARLHKEDLDLDLDIDDNWENDLPRSLTVRQLQEAKFAFALFFPGVDEKDPSLNTKRLGLKEVQEAAKTLKENLSSNDTKEMLGMFSSAPDGSIGLEEFGRMAVMARLI
ncbi:unnamed protein product [Rhizoctonia solani]|uniref:EF-hand domain-containing protein n=1 Tax=Rhizoctonia solani TaxID=456999 RepID=A0A8H3HFW2_9AGAM|nr:unnamed protein product [Rhizoctonia solani]